MATVVIDFVGKRMWFYLISAAVLVPGLIFLILNPGLKPGIDFTGGSTITILVDSEVDQNDIRQAVTAFGRSDAVIQRMDASTFFIRTKELTDADRDGLVQQIESDLSTNVTVLAFDLVSATVASETILNAFYALLAATVGIFLYLWWAFRNVPNPISYGAAACIALLHDALIVIGVFAILGYFLDMEVNSPFLVALLTVIGYSVNDTIVVFDRLRENQLDHPSRPLARNANISVMETITRSLNTGITVLLTIVALLLLGGATIREFLLVLLIGLLAGTYSSIAIATPFLVMWEDGTFGRFFGRFRSRRKKAEAAAPVS